MQIKIIGGSSKKEITLELNEKDLNKNLMEFLKENSLPVASSCRGEGICKLCIVNEKTLSCQVTLRGFLSIDKNIIRISYL